MSQIIDKMMDFWKIVLVFSQWEKCIDKCSSVSWTVVTWLRNYKLYHFGSSIQLGVTAMNAPNYRQND